MDESPDESESSGDDAEPAVHEDAAPGDDDAEPAVHEDAAPGDDDVEPADHEDAAPSDDEMEPADHEGAASDDTPLTVAKWPTGSIEEQTEGPDVDADQEEATPAGGNGAAEAELARRT